MKTKFYTADGMLTDYALACGYVEVQKMNDNRITLEKEHSVYHVKGITDAGAVWESFETLAAARKRFRQLTRQFCSEVAR